MAIHTENSAPATSQPSAANSQPASVSFALGASFEPNKLYSLALKDIQVELNKSGRVFTVDDVGVIDLAENIREVGMLQPILVRPGSEGFIIVAGERRYRAALVAGWDSIPAMFNAENPALVSLIENLHRTDLTGVQKAESLARLQESDPKRFTVKYLSKMLGKNTNSMSEDLKLAKLPVEVLDKYRNDIRCNCALLRTARQAYDASKKELGIEPTSDKYASGLIEYIDEILAKGISVTQLRDKRAAIKSKAKAEAAAPAVPSLEEKAPDSLDVSGETTESGAESLSTDLVSDNAETDAKAADAPDTLVELDATGIPSTHLVSVTETPTNAADVAIAAVQKLRESIIGVVSDLDLEHRQTIAGLLKEILALVE